MESHEEGEWARRQWKWLERDFKKARSNYAATPWIIAYHHHPFYCSSRDPVRCPMNGRREIRFGEKGVPGLEQLYVDYSVELVFEGHEHFYERFLPFNQSGSGVIKDDKKTGIHEGTVHIITGAAGNPEGLYEFRDDHIPESIVRKREFGFTLLTVDAPDRLKIEQIAVKLNSAVIDSLVLAKSKDKTLQF
ncbi:iron/zinc purple acid phosphatase-like protein C domain-containing protein [Ditylenchus destructor]|uniref:Iron/zinc purple acid phosphatase-like protein C domain-containing protein n=1 Tax=Ditylenchus destructor TaxID=166010 RepID=A0AAD4NKC3_9BILA|nr:iron/zinc purple acid phosphatase-like protein C domain-containing protein [Ditylenchus destructor]